MEDPFMEIAHFISVG